MKVDDVVKIVRQPSNQHIQLVGTIAFIQEIDKDRVSVIALRSSGETMGMGTVPLDCVELETDPKWLAAKKAYDRRMGALFAEYEERTNCYNKVVQAVAKKYKVSKKTAKKIHDTLSNWEEYYREHFKDE